MTLETDLIRSLFEAGVTKAEIRRRIGHLSRRQITYICGAAPESERRAKNQEVVMRLEMGQSYREVAAAVGLDRGVISSARRRATLTRAINTRNSPMDLAPHAVPTREERQTLEGDRSDLRVIVNCHRAGWLFRDPSGKYHTTPAGLSAMQRTTS